jgi:hypothetical protein
MSVTLDGQDLFDERQLEIEPGSFSRDSIERTAAGLDGVLSIDLGGRGRKIKQKGVLRARSRTEMEEKKIAISAYMDGDMHTLVTGSGEEFANLRMDVFKVSRERTTGSGLCCDYEIVYRQLVV